MVKECEDEKVYRVVIFPEESTGAPGDKGLSIGGGVTGVSVTLCVVVERVR